MPEECAICGDRFAVRDGGHITLNPPTGDVRAHYTCPKCYEAIATRFEDAE